MKKLEAEATQNGAYLFVPRLTLSYLSYIYQAYLPRNATSYRALGPYIKYQSRKCPAGMHKGQGDGAGSSMHTGQGDGVGSGMTQARVMEPVLPLRFPLSRCVKIYVKFTEELTTPCKLKFFT